MGQRKFSSIFSSSLELFGTQASRNLGVAIRAGTRHGGERRAGAGRGAHAALAADALRALLRRPLRGVSGAARLDRLRVRLDPDGDEDKTSFLYAEMVF